MDKDNLFGLKAYSKSLKCFFKVVVWYPNEDDMTKWQIYISTDDSMSSKDVIDCYRTRLQLEFCFKDANHYAGLTTASQPTSENSSSIGTYHSLVSISPRSPARNWGYRSQYHPASRLSITLICSIVLFACSVCKRTHKLLTNFSKNWFYLLPGPPRTWKI